MRVLAARLIATYERLFGESVPFVPEWEAAVAREVAEQQRRAAASPAPAPAARRPHPAIDAPSEQTRILTPLPAVSRVTYVGRDVLKPVATTAAAPTAARAGASASR